MTSSFSNYVYLSQVVQCRKYVSTYDKQRPRIFLVIISYWKPCTTYKKIKYKHRNIKKKNIQ